MIQTLLRTTHAVGAIVWLLEGSACHALERVEFQAPARDFFVQKTPLGKLPTIEDGDVVMGESGAIVECVLERYGNGRLAPPVGSPPGRDSCSGCTSPEHRISAPRYRRLAHALPPRRRRHPTLIADARTRAAAGFEQLERELRGKQYLLGDTFSAADIMIGFTLIAGRMLGVIDDRYPVINGYLERLQGRPTVAADAGDRLIGFERSPPQYRTSNCSMSVRMASSALYSTCFVCVTPPQTANVIQPPSFLRGNPAMPQTECGSSMVPVFSAMRSCQPAPPLRRDERALARYETAVERSKLRVS
jgi:glutathione S-transferase